MGSIPNGSAPLQACARQIFDSCSRILWFWAAPGRRKFEDNIKISESIEGEECFITGSKVDDFHTLDKNYIYTLNVCATQELYKLIEQQNIIIQDLQNRINILENNKI